MGNGFNCTTVTLVPKMPPTYVKDYRPIACYTICYKIITKVLIGRLKKVIGDLIGKAQSAFIKERIIGDNILFAHEIFNSYNKKGISS